MIRKRLPINPNIRLTARLAACSLFFFVLTMSAMLPTGFPSASGMSTHRAGLVVQFADSSIETRCIQFSEETISGYELLIRSDIPFLAAFSSQGAAICKIRGDGCPENDCFCQSPPNYWSYWQLDEYDWVYSPVGSSASQVVDGMVQGWRWGTGLKPDQVISLETVCAQATETSTSERPTSSKTPTHTPTATTTLAYVPNQNPVIESTYQPVVISTDQAVFVAELPTSTPTASPTNTLTTTNPTSTNTPAPTYTSTSTASSTSSNLPTASATQTIQVNPTNTVVVRETCASPTPSPSPTEKKRKPENTLTPTKRQGFQKSQSTSLAFVQPDNPAVDIAMAESKPNYARVALLAGGVVGYIVFLLIFGGLLVGLVIVWRIRQK